MAITGQYTQASTEAVLSETLTTVATIPTAGIERVCIYLSNNGPSALDQFAIQVKVHKDAPFKDAYSTSDDYLSPAGILKGSSGDLSVLPAGDDGWFIIEVRGLYQLNLQAAQAAGSPSTLVIRLGGN